MQRERDQLRVTARLVEAASDKIVWSLRVERNQQDVFAIQDEIAAQVTRALSVSVSPGGRERMHGQGTRNVEAYLEFLEGQDALSTWRTHEAGIAAAHFNRALLLDPQFARALVMLARAQMRDAEYSAGAVRTSERDGTLTSGVEAADPRALTWIQAGRSLCERPTCAVSSIRRLRNSDYRKAIELTPATRAIKGWRVDLAGSASKRKWQLAGRAHGLDPLDLALDVARALYLFYGLREVEEADLLLRQVLERIPNYVPAWPGTAKCC